MRLSFCMRSFDLPEHAGGKVRGLTRLRESGYRVPAFFWCDGSWSEVRVNEALRQRLPKVDYFAVRSSAESEDSETQSFAGRFHTGLGIPKDRVYMEIQRVITSFEGQKGSVVVQEFIPSDASGVMFTSTQNGFILINATRGLGVTVVNGGACDEYICTRDGVIVHKNLSVKKALIFRDGSFVDEESRGDSLSSDQLSKLCALARDVEARFGAPQDIEWCIKDELFVVQARPITRAVLAPLVEYFDSANIAESYSGIVLPLTCSFAQMVYAQIYRDLLSASGVPQAQLDRHAHVFDRLLGFFSGRMYYNMNNWYRMAEFVPGYSRNKRNFEVMITSNVRSELIPVIEPSIRLRFLYPVIVGFKVLLYGFAARRFAGTVERKLRELRHVDIGSLSLAECRELFATINTELLRKWYIAVENDFFVMTYLGALKKLVPESDIQPLLVFPSKATEQVVALASLSRELFSRSDTREALETRDVAAFRTALVKDTGARECLRKYFDEFGGRFANELKLESVGLDEDHERLMLLLSAYRAYKKPVAGSEGAVTSPRRSSLVVRYLVRKFKLYAAQREEFRLMRSNTFSMARRLFRRMGELLKEEGIISHHDDVFYLELKELLDTSSTDLRSRVADRKKAYATYSSTRPPAFFVATRGVPIREYGATVSNNALSGRPASPGRITGAVRLFPEFTVPSAVDFSIVVARHTDPGWTPLIALARGLIIEHGGVLSHASIVARELGVPAVIGVEGALDTLKDGQTVTIDGDVGTIEVHS